LQADLEEAKTQENAKLQAALQEMELQFKETKALLVKEREAAKEVVEQVPVIQEVPVIDNAMVEKLTAENEKLKVNRPNYSLLAVSVFHKLVLDMVMWWFWVQFVFCHFFMDLWYSSYSQALVSSLEQKIDETEKKFEETSKLSEERLKQALDAESKVVKLKTAMQRSI